MPIIMAMWGLFTFLIVEVFIFLPLYIVGVPVAWLADRLAMKHFTPSRLFPERFIVSYENRLLDWWVGNYEDGVKPEFDWWPAEKTALQWFLRNPVTNLRFTPILSTKPCPIRVKWVGSNEVPANAVPACFLAWQGPYVGFLYQNTKWGVWIGWKINPRDAFFVPSDDYRRWGIGTACQLMRF